MQEYLKFIYSLAQIDGSYDEKGFADLKQLLSWTNAVTLIVLVEDKLRVSGETIPVFSMTALLNVLLRTDYRSDVVYLTFGGRKHLVTSKVQAKEHLIKIRDYVKNLYEKQELENISIRATAIPRKSLRLLGDSVVNNFEIWLGQVYPVVLNFVKTKGLSSGESIGLNTTAWGLMGNLIFGTLLGNLHVNELFHLPAKNFILTANFMNHRIVEDKKGLPKHVYKVKGTDVVINCEMLEIFGFLTASLTGCLKATEQGILFETVALK